MSPLLDQAVAEARKLTDSEQDAIAALILEEIEDDRQWEAALTRSPGRLAALKTRAEEQVREGRCRQAELPVLLQHAPTKEKCMLLARAFGRGYGSIEQKFRWVRRPIKTSQPSGPTMPSFSRSSAWVGAPIESGFDSEWGTRDRKKKGNVARYSDGKSESRCAPILRLLSRSLSSPRNRDLKL
jgi:hypothetical protein